MSDVEPSEPAVIVRREDRHLWEPDPNVWPIPKPANPKVRLGTGKKCPQWVKDKVLERLPIVGTVKAMEEASYHVTELYDWAREDPDYQKRFDAARKARAHNLAEESVNLLDEGSADTPEDPKRASAHVNLLNARSRARQWLASKYNPADYGEKLEHTGTVTSAVVMLPPLDPLPATARLAPETQTAGQLQAPAVEVEVITD